MLFLVLILIGLGLLAPHRAFGLIMPASVVDKVEQDFIKQGTKCDLIITEPAWAHVPVEAVAERPTFVVGMDDLSSDGMNMVMAEQIKLRSVCIILVALQAQTQQERVFYEKLVSHKALSSMILLTTGGDIRRGLYHCSLRNWHQGRQTFHLDLTKTHVSRTARAEMGLAGLEIGL